jgi:uncharacterized secreted protein with C-terminal beta-propeller domain
MAELYDEEGNPVEALTAEEVEAKVQEATEAAKTEVNDQLVEKEAELEKLRSKETNFANLRTKTEKQTEQESELQKRIAEMEGKIEEAKGAGAQVFLDSVKDKSIEGLADGDEVLQAKIEEQYEVLNLPTATEAQINERVRRAYLLASEGQVVGNTLRGSMTPPQGSGRSLTPQRNDAAPSADLAEFGRRFGLSDDDWKTHGGAKTTKA